MDEAKIEERFNQLEKRVNDGFLRMEDLIEVFSRRVDSESEYRRLLAMAEENLKLALTSLKRS